jgi:hypothetical protein
MVKRNNVIKLHAVRPKKQKTVKSKIAQPVLLDLGCGQAKQEGHIGVDLYAPQADIKADLFKFPWTNWKDGSIDGIFCSHFIEHIPKELRWRFFEECYRIMKLESVMRIFVPSLKSERAYGDNTHEWPPVCTWSFFYLDRNWREANKLTHGPYNINCNFLCQAGPTAITPSFADRTQEAQVFACAHNWEAYPDLWVTLTKKA